MKTVASCTAVDGVPPMMRGSRSRRTVVRTVSSGAALLHAASPKRTTDETSQTLRMRRTPDAVDAPGKRGT